MGWRIDRTRPPTSPFWGNDLPKTSDRWNKYGKQLLATRSAENREEIARDAITGRGTSSAMWLDFGKYGIWFRDLLLPARRATLLGQLLGGSRTPQVAAPAPKPIAKWAYPATELPAAGSVLAASGGANGGVAASMRLAHLALMEMVFPRRKSPVSACA